MAEEAPATVESPVVEPVVEPVAEPVAEPVKEAVKEPEAKKVAPVKVKKEKVKKVKKPSRKIEEEEDDDERVYDEDGSIFKTKAWKKNWDKICLALLLLAILVPVGLLAYIIMQFFK